MYYIITSFCQFALFNIHIYHQWIPHTIIIYNAYYKDCDIHSLFIPITNKTSYIIFNQIK